MSEIKRYTAWDLAETEYCYKASDHDAIVAEKDKTIADRDRRIGEFEKALADARRYRSTNYDF